METVGQMIDVETEAQSDEELAHIHTMINHPLLVPFPYFHTKPEFLDNKPEMSPLKRERG